MPAAGTVLRPELDDVIITTLSTKSHVRPSKLFDLTSERVEFSNP